MTYPVHDICLNSLFFLLPLVEAYFISEGSLVKKQTSFGDGGKLHRNRWQIIQLDTKMNEKRAVPVILAGL